MQLEYKDLTEDLPSDVLANCQVELLMAVQMESNASIRRKICDAVAELARSSLGMYVCMYDCAHVITTYRKLRVILTLTLAG